MSIKLMLLKTGETIITTAKEVVSDEVVRGYLLENPHYVDAKKQDNSVYLTEGSSGMLNYALDVLLTPWIILSKDKEFIVATDYVVTICDPIPALEKMYVEKTGNVQKESKTEVVKDD